MISSFLSFSLCQLMAAPDRDTDLAKIGLAVVSCHCTVSLPAMFVTVDTGI